MTELLYLGDSYLRSFNAQVLDAKSGAVLLDRTAFYPGGGGQPADVGRLNQEGRSWRVAGFERQGGELWHKLEGGEGMPTGGEVAGELDWPRRYHFMRTHTALHILCGIIFREFGALVTGCQMYEDRARMDFALEDLAVERIAFIEGRLGEIVAQGHPVRVYSLPRVEALKIPDLIRTQVNLLPEHIQEVRIVEIEGLDLQADGGTHVGNTREVGKVAIIGTENKGRINKRLTIKLSQ